MITPKLAINGGEKIKTDPFPDQITYGEEERDTVNKFMTDRKILSGYRGNWIPAFWGGSEVQKFEDQWSEKIGCNYTIAVNSCTSALQLACIAIGLKSGDEVIVTPWSMSCSATAPLICGATPVFADINDKTFILDPESIEAKITNKTKAIIVVDLFGRCFPEEINDVAEKHGLIIIEDAAQAPGAYRINRDGSKSYAGTLGDVGCFSFTQGKHLTCGEGGAITTNEYKLAMKCAMLRNHSDAVISSIESNTNMDIDFYFDFGFIKQMGFNLRMTELNAVIMQEQIKKLDRYVSERQGIAMQLARVIEEACPFISSGIPSEEFQNHALYVQPFYFDENKARVKRDVFIDAVKAELTGERSRPDRPMLSNGYINPLYNMPIFSHIGVDMDMDASGFTSFSTVQRLQKKEFFLSMYHNLPIRYTPSLYTIGSAFKKVTENIDELDSKGDFLNYKWRRM